ncbi:MAG: sugar phosphate isomerase/epimerase [Methanomassiliicoccales archaeon]
MPAPDRFGVMATLDDIEVMARLPVDFLELLVRANDTPAQIDRLLSAFDGEIILHAPELITWHGGTSLLDLAAEEGLRDASVARLQEVADAARDHAVPMVVHPGGVLERAVPPGPLLERLERSLGELDGFFWLENMPRGYHRGHELWIANLMVGAEQMLQVQNLVDGFVLDTAHAYLSREEDGNGALQEMFTMLGDNVRHVHLSDAAYPHQEGLPLGWGEVDLTRVPRGRGLPILLEIQGGHENAGEGFRAALRFIGRKA